MVLVHARRRCCPSSARSSAATRSASSTERGVEIHTTRRSQRVTDEEVTLSDGATLPARTLVWTAGTTPNPLLATLPCKPSAGGSA